MLPGYTILRLKLVDRRGIEPRTPPCKGGVFPSIPTALNLAPEAGIEPTTNWLTANCTTAVLLWNNMVEAVRFEPTSLLRTDLQSAATLPLRRASVDV